MTLSDTSSNEEMEFLYVQTELDDDWEIAETEKWAEMEKRLDDTNVTPTALCQYSSPCNWPANVTTIL